MSQAHTRVSSVDRGGFIVLAVIAALIVEQVVLVPLTWVTVNYLIYGTFPQANYLDWSMTATFEANLVVQVAAVVLTVGIILLSAGILTVLRRRTTSLAFG